MTLNLHHAMLLRSKSAEKTKIQTILLVKGYYHLSSYGVGLFRRPLPIYGFETPTTISSSSVGTFDFEKTSAPSTLPQICKIC